MKPLACFFPLIFFAVACKEKKLAPGSATKWPDSVQYHLKRIQQIKRLFKKKEIASELSARGIVSAFRKNYPTVYFRDTLPTILLDLSQYKNQILGGFTTTELHEAFRQVSKEEQSACIYHGKDNRYEVSNPLVNKFWHQSEQVLGIFPITMVNTTRNPIHIDTTQPLKSALEAVEDYPLCDNSTFGDQPSAAIGTAFPLSTNTIITAAHCFDNGKPIDSVLLINQLKNYCFALGFYYDANGHLQADLQQQNYFLPLRVKYYRPLSLDCVIIELDHSMTPERVPPIAAILPKNEDGIYMIGFPNGIPEKITTDAYITTDSYQDSTITLKTDLDAFKGNSGSPVFESRSNKIIGMLINGGQDYHTFYMDYWSGCSQYEQCDAVTGGETILNMIYLRKKITL